MTDDKLNSTNRLYREVVGKQMNFLEERNEFYRQQYEARRTRAGRIWPHWAVPPTKEKRGR